MSLRVAVLVFGAVVFPPLPVFLLCGISPQLLVALLLSLAGHLPGVAYALYVIYQDTHERRPLPDIESFTVSTTSPPTAVVVKPIEEPLLSNRHKDDPHQSKTTHSTPEQGPSDPTDFHNVSQPPPAYDLIVGDNKIQI